MSAKVSVDFLLRVAQATPEQQAAIERYLASADPRALSPAVDETEARKLFALLQQLEGTPLQRKAPLASVFRLVVMNGMSVRKVASRCGCAASLISARVKTIEGTFQMTVQKLRAYASALNDIETSVKGTRMCSEDTHAAEDEEF